MFCDRCGTQMQPDSSACPNCGRRIPDPVRALAGSRLERHLRTLSILWMAIGGLFAIPAVGLMVFGRAARFVIHDREPWPGLFSLLLFVAGSTLPTGHAQGRKTHEWEGHDFSSWSECLPNKVRIRARLQPCRKTHEIESGFSRDQRPRPRFPQAMHKAVRRTNGKGTIFRRGVNAFRIRFVSGHGFSRAVRRTK